MCVLGAGRELKKFNQMISEIHAAYHEASWKLGLSDSAEHILYAICQQDGKCLLRDIVRLSGISKQTINSGLRKLEQEGILSVETLQNRKKQVCLTEKGKKLTQQTTQQIIEIENEIYSEWTMQEMETYLELTGRYLSAFQEKTKDLKRRENQ